MLCISGGCQIDLFLYDIYHDALPHKKTPISDLAARPGSEETRGGSNYHERLAKGPSKVPITTTTLYLLNSPLNFANVRVL